ncbi:hypothetical protein D3C77_638650 [compost metagenome]
MLWATTGIALFGTQVPCSLKNMLRTIPGFGFRRAQNRSERDTEINLTFVERCSGSYTLHQITRLSQRLAPQCIEIGMATCNLQRRC